MAVTWWETNQKSDTPVARISIEGRQTFGPMLRLATNGTIGSIEAEGVVEVLGVLEVRCDKKNL